MASRRNHNSLNLSSHRRVTKIASTAPNPAATPFNTLVGESGHCFGHLSSFGGLIRLLRSRGRGLLWQIGTREGTRCRFPHRPCFSRDSSRAVDVGCHAPPRGVRMPRSFNSAAIARTLAIPWVPRSSTMALRFDARYAAFALTAATACLLPTCLPLSAGARETH
jgi:hypothetical protein